MATEVELLRKLAEIGIKITDPNDEPIELQNPLPVDGDSVYCKDIDATRSIMGDFSGEVCDLFNNLYTSNANTTATNPKLLTIAFHRSTVFSSFGLGCNAGDSFSNIKVVGIASGGAEFTIFDESSDNTKRTTKTINLNTPIAVTKLRFEFYTTDTICLSNLFIFKLREVIANAANESSPLHVNDTDHNKRTALNTVFGDRVIGHRIPSLAAQFQYGLAGDDASGTPVGSGNYVVEDSLLKLRTGTDSNGAFTMQSTNYVRYIPGYEAWMAFTAVFTQGVADSHQYAGLYDDNDGFYIGYKDSQFIIGRRRSGVDYHTTIDETKVLPFEKFDPTKGNVYMITFGYLGFAPINFSILDSDGIWRNLGRIEYPNTETETHITQTNLPVRAEVVNAGNTTNLEFRSGSLAAGIVDGGGSDPAVRSFTYKTGLVSITSGNVLIVAFRSKTTYNSIENRISSLLTLISAATDTSKIAQWSLLDNPPYTGGTWTDIDVDSTLEYSTDTTITDFTGDTFIDWTMGRLDTFFEEVKEFNLNLRPGKAAAFAVQLPGGANGDVGLSIRWDELF
jgi:hypothetical protein